jgi:hypothetical protein
MTPLGSPPFRREIIRSCPPNVPEKEKRTDRTGFVPLLVDRIPQNGVFGKGIAFWWSKNVTPPSGLSISSPTSKII